MAFKPKSKERVDLTMVCGTCHKPISDKPRSDITRFLFWESRCNCITPDASAAATPAPAPGSEHDGSHTAAIDLDGSNDFEPGVASRSTEAMAEQLPDRYHVISLLGEGGVGTVYKVRDVLLDKVFAIKVLHGNLVTARNAVLRFQQEAKAASKLNHPHLVSVYHFDTSPSGSPFLVMDYIEGESLSSILDREGSLNIPRALDIFVEVSEAMVYAHNEGVIHRDIKPSNIIVTKGNDGTDYVKLVDFGIAKVLPQPGHDTQHLTQTGEVFGSPYWMSPEQCLGNKLDFRADIYSLGCVMYEALTGKPPFQGDNAIQTIFKHVNEPPRPMGAVAKDAEIPSDLEAIVMRTIEKDPDDRYQSMTELLKDLQTVRDGKQVSFRKKTGKLRKALSFKNPRFRVGYFSAMSILAVVMIVQMLQPATVSRLNPYSDAQQLDSLSYRYFTSGEYEKAIPLLEFGIKTYRQNGREDAYLADNLQHVGKCYLMLGQYDKAKPYYEEALSIYKRLPNPRQSMMPEAQADYAKVLAGLEKASHR